MDEKSAEWTVNNWPGLRGEAKRSFHLCWKKNGHQPGELWISDIELMELNGTSGRAVRRYLETLSQKRLIRILERLPGRTRIYLCEPREVCNDGKQEAERPLLEPFAELAGASNRRADSATYRAVLATDVTPEPPRLRDPLGYGYAHRPLPLDPLEPLLPEGRGPQALPEPAPDAAPHPTDKASPPAQRSSQQPDRETAALADIERRARAGAAAGFRPSQPAAAPPRVDFRGAAARAEYALPGNPARSARIEQIVERIRTRVADPEIRETPMLRFATAIVDNLVPERELDSVLLSIDRARRDKTLMGSPWWYFVGAGRKIFKRHGIEDRWPTEAPEGRK